MYDSDGQTDTNAVELNLIFAQQGELQLVCFHFFGVVLSVVLKLNTTFFLSDQFNKELYTKYIKQEVALELISCQS